MTARTPQIHTNTSPTPPAPRASLFPGRVAPRDRGANVPARMSHWVMDGVDEFLWAVYTTRRAQHLTAKAWYFLAWYFMRANAAWCCSARVEEIVAAGISHTAYYNVRALLKKLELLETRLVDDEIEFRLLMPTAEVEKRPMKPRGSLAGKIPDQGLESQIRDSTVVASTPVFNSFTRSSKRRGAEADPPEVTTTLEILMRGDDGHGNNAPVYKSMRTVVLRLAKDANTLGLLPEAAERILKEWQNVPFDRRKPALLVWMMENQTEGIVKAILKRRAKDKLVKEKRVDRDAQKSASELQALAELAALEAARQAFSRLPAAKQLEFHRAIKLAGVAPKYQRWKSGQPLPLAVAAYQRSLKPL